MSYRCDHVTAAGESFFAITHGPLLIAELRGCANHSEAGAAYWAFMARPLTINGRKFVRTEREFDAGGCHGYYRHVRGGFVLMTWNTREPIACLVNNKHGERFFVNAFDFNGRTRYQHSTGAHADAYLGLTGLEYRARNELADKAVRDFNNAAPRVTSGAGENVS